jgi:hypothetical protein
MDVETIVLDAEAVEFVPIVTEYEADAVEFVVIGLEVMV